MVKSSSISKEDFLNSPSFESITRARRKAQADHPELEASEYVKRARSFIESKKGFHVYHEEVDVDEKGLRQGVIDSILDL